MEHYPCSADQAKGKNCLGGREEKLIVEERVDVEFQGFSSGRSVKPGQILAGSQEVLTLRVALEPHTTQSLMELPAPV